MNPVEKFSIAVQDMWGKNTPWCHGLGALLMVAERECEPSPELDALKEHIKKMQQQVLESCGSHDILRSLTGALELASGVEPRFYVDKDAGSTRKGFCPVAGGGSD